MTDCQVLIVGGGPVGLALAIDLGQRGVGCLLIDKRAEPSFLPKMERCHARTMEHFRRLGIADQVRGAGYPEHLPLDAFLVTTLAEQAIARISRPSVIAARRESHEHNDGSSPAEPYQIVSQYALEPLLKSVAEKTAGVRVQFGCELVSLEEKDEQIVARVRHADGTEKTISALYLAGCDGASSAVRAGLGFRLEGKANIGEQMQALFHAEDLFDRIGMGKGAHYYRADDRWTFLITQGDTRHFSLHAMTDDEAEMPALFEALAGMPIAYTTLYVGKWTMRLMLSNRYASKRAFLAGDSAHLVTPNGGLGMNTGIGDAIDLAWKLAAVIQGWGGAGLLPSYEIERRPIGARNVNASERAYLARRVWRDLCEDAGGALVDAGSGAAREKLGRVWLEEHGKGSFMANIVLGYRYLNSPIIAYEADDDGADQASDRFVPTTRAGARIPHLWLADGSALQDHVGKGFTLVTCRPSVSEIGGIETAFRALRCPFRVLDVRDTPHARDVYQRTYLLLRPDLHVAWRGDRLPEDVARLAGQVTGHI